MVTEDRELREETSEGEGYVAEFLKVSLRP